MDVDIMYAGSARSQIVFPQAAGTERGWLLSPFNSF